MSRNNSRDESIFSALEDTQELLSLEVPPGYIKVELSTKGKLGAPEVLHIRNFKISEVMLLSITDEADLPIRLSKILNDMILEDVNTGLWHEKEVEELLVYLYSVFYKDEITNVPYSFTKEELEKIQKLPAGDQIVKDIRSGFSKPTTGFRITRDVETYDIPDDFSADVTVADSTGDFTVTFGYVKYRDKILIKKWLDRYFLEDARRYAPIAQKIRYNENIYQVATTDPEKLSSLIAIDPDEEAAYKDYIAERFQVTSDIIKIASIIDYNGEDISNMSLDEKYKLLKDDARLDYNLMAAAEKQQENIFFGIKPFVTMRNPVTNEPVERRFSFRVSSILQAMYISGSDAGDSRYTIEN